MIDIFNLFIHTFSTMVTIYPFDVFTGGMVLSLVFALLKKLIR